MPSAIYNEITPYAVSWLRNLIAAGHVAPGVVDDRSIRDLKPDDVAGDGQRHFFAGIGVWSSALRAAGWSDDVSVWTGSCPCQPFSTAGRRGGIADERHLWPEWFRLIRECRPAVILGEQVASPDGLAWLDAVSSDLEGAGYSFAAADLCAAGVGAPHIRQRLYFVALADVQRRESVGLHLRQRRSQPGVLEARRGGEARGVDDDDDERLEGHAGHGDVGIGRSRATRPAPEAGVPCRLESPSLQGSGRDAGAVPRAEREGARERQLFGRVVNLAEPTSHVGGFWRDAEWVLCRDGKARPIEPGTFPLAHGPAQRMGRLHAYGNAIVAPLAQTFIEAVMDIL